MATGNVGLTRRGTEGQDVTFAANRLGAAITTELLLQWALEGRTFFAQQGDAITPLSFGETAYDEDQPQFALTVPHNTTVIPLSIEVNLQDQAGTDTNIAVSMATNDIGIGTSTPLTITPMRTDQPEQSRCKANSLYTGNATAATGLVEIARAVDPFAALQGHGIVSFYWNVREAAAIPILVGPATLQWHIVSAATAPAGYAQIVWAEFPTADLINEVA